MKSEIRNYAKFRADCMDSFKTDTGLRGEEIPQGIEQNEHAESDSTKYAVQVLIYNGHNAKWYPLPYGRAYFGTLEEATERLADVREEYGPGTRSDFLGYTRLGLRVVSIRERIVRDTTVGCVVYEKGTEE